MRILGRAFVFGDFVDTDVLAPGPYLRKPLPELAAQCLKALDPSFPQSVRPGDIVVGGVGFGIGSSREQAVQALIHLGVGCVVARGFARIFFRNAINLGLPVLVCPDIAVAAGSRLEVLPAEGLVTQLESGRRWQAEPLPPRLMEILAAGGLMPWLRRRLRPSEERR
jgi:3-isopropylmalate dehydratase small subunit